MFIHFRLEHLFLKTGEAVWTFVHTVIYQMGIIAILKSIFRSINLSLKFSTILLFE